MMQCRFESNFRTVDGLGFPPAGMRCVESMFVPFTGVTSLIVIGLDPVTDADRGHR